MEKLFYLNPAENKDEALPLGNGRIGAMLYGGVSEDVYTLNDDTLWSGYPRDRINPMASSCLEDVRKLISEDKLRAAQDLAEQRMYGSWGQSYLPAGRLTVSTDHNEFSDYKRTLSLDEAVHTVEYSTRSLSCKREAFISCPDDVMCIRYSGSSNLSLHIGLDSKLKFNTFCENGMLFLEGEAPGDCVPSYIKSKEKARYSDVSSLRAMTFTILVQVRTDGGKTVCRDKKIFVDNARAVEIYLTIRTSFSGYNRHPYLEGINHKEKCLDVMAKIRDMSFDVIKKRHIDDYSNLYHRLELDLGNGFDDVPSDRRLADFSQNKNDLSLYKLMYQYGRYLLISCSRPGTQPANLQGIWNEELAAPWSCNYTTNINVQMNYWGALGSALAECCQPLHKMIYELKESGTQTAREHYSASGFCVHHNVDLWRITSPMGAWGLNTTKYAYFPLAGAWLTRHLFEYYSYTLDKEFLGGSAYEAIKASVQFCDDMLVEDESGKLIFSPATSSENMFVYNGENCSLSKSSAMFQSIVRDAFEIFVKCSDILDRDREYADYISKRLKRIAWLEIGSKGQILEWDREFHESDIHHRHLSHLYALYPAKMIHTKPLKQACRRSIELRGDAGTGWSCAWKICLWAMLGDGNRALSLIDRLMTPVRECQVNYSGGGTYPNFLNAHPPFQIDGSLGLLAGINEMLAQCENDKLILLPALPDKWSLGFVKGLQVSGGYTVDLSWQNGELKTVRIKSLTGKIPEIIYKGRNLEYDKFSGKQQ